MTETALPAGLHAELLHQPETDSQHCLSKERRRRRRKVYAVRRYNGSFCTHTQPEKASVTAHEQVVMTRSVVATNSHDSSICPFGALPCPMCYNQWGHS